jgi:ArsR family transcriptional regulator, cadmium/lead-responsive transcriptional repressor
VRLSASWHPTSAAHLAASCSTTPLTRMSTAASQPPQVRRVANTSPHRKVGTASDVFSDCCTVCPVETLTYGQVLARFGHALSDPTRSRLLLALREGPGYPAELAELLGTTRQNLSNHLACLRGCGLVVAIPEGRRARYELVDARLAHALGDLLGVVIAVDPAACADSPTQDCC